MVCKNFREAVGSRKQRETHWAHQGLIPSDIIRDGFLQRIEWTVNLPVDDNVDKLLPKSSSDWDKRLCMILAWPGLVTQIQKLGSMPGTLWWNCFLLRELAKRGLLEQLQWATSVGCCYDCDASNGCASVASGGHLKVLRWARETAGWRWGPSTCASAASGGHLEVLQWARDNGCDWNCRTCTEAALGGHLETLQWAMANGCDYPNYTGSIAQEYGHTEMVTWLRQSKYHDVFH
jgi:hypothetical protein